MLTLFLLTYIIVVLVLLGAGTFFWVLHITAAVACLGCIICYKKTLGRTGHLSYLAIAFIALLTFTVLPLPSFLGSVIGQERARQNELVRTALDETARLHLIKEANPHFSLSRNRAGTMRMILLVISGLATAALSSRLSSKWRERYLKTLVIIVFLVAIAGYISQWIIPQGKHIWWFFPVAHGAPVGSFINRNHFGGFVAMLCPAALILFADSLSQKRFWPSLFWGTVFLVMSLAAIMSLSRGVWVAYATSGLIIVMLLLSRKRVFMGIGIIVLISFVSVGISRLSNAAFDERVESLKDISQSQSSGQMRLSTWRDSLRILPDYPIFGTGANAFHMVFPFYRTATTRQTYKHAENEYVQLMVECGLAGIILIIGLCASVAKKWRDSCRYEAISRVVSLSVGGALIVVLVHAVFDFALRVPLYFVVFMSLLGLVLSSRRILSSTRSARVERPDIASRMRSTAVPAMGCIMVIILSTVGKNIYDLDSSDFLQKAETEQLCQALVWNPTSWQAWYHLGRSAIMAGSPESYRFGERCIIQATEYDPNNYRLWRELCLYRLSQNDRPGAQDAYTHLKQLRGWVRIEEMEKVFK